ncbi:MAG: TetR/AcrR family transcriptional regulator [Candidatus Zixiibacteriota bacterium]|nr:MAG: TetR/AcrR family transcriptional regulator [candidate division Zixibacteria bacterium]
MAKIKQSPKQPAEKRREQLLKAARELFHKKGYRETTTEEIARRARLTKGALYHHFRNKEDVLYELIVDISRRRRERLLERVAKGAAPAQVLKIILADEDRWFRHDWNYHIDIWLQAMKLPRIRRLMTEQMELFIEILTDRLDRRFGNQKQRRNMALFTLSLFHGLYVRKILGPDLINVTAQTRLFGSLLATSNLYKPVRKRNK